MGMKECERRGFKREQQGNSVSLGGDNLETRIRRRTLDNVPNDSRV